ncbi:cupredoxin domain-containing protein [Pseudoduganella namucuonensis]|uniref:cupredoxin domain-containing protein n=1 Tax=Pseudoduganella namucuonensis TaxID=1035707 RepID=UPI001E583762|nr:hypothetical protein [Pseudoduganella namucuonensis]
MRIRAGRLPLYLLAPLLLAAGAFAGLAAWAAYAPIAPASRDQPFEIPKGTWARRMAGEKIEILPSEIHLTLGANDVLLLRNLDDVPQIFGPVLIMPGQSFRLPFERAGENQFACTAHASGQMSVIVAPTPAAGWARLKWRIENRHLLGHAWIN